MSLLDMIGPVMIGPSSSHTAGACRIGLVARAVLGGPPTSAKLTLHGSFAKTGLGHGTDRALVAGLLGFRPDDERLPGSLSEAEAAGLHLEWAVANLGEVHPNTVKLTVSGEPGVFEVLASSVGGGVIEVLNVNGFEVHFTGSQSTLLVLHQDTFGAIARVTRLVADDRVNIATLTCNRERRGGAALMALELDQPLSATAVTRVSELLETTWVRMLAPVMDAGEATGGP